MGQKNEVIEARKPEEQAPRVNREERKGVEEFTVDSEDDDDEDTGDDDSSAVELIESKNPEAPSVNKEATKRAAELTVDSEDDDSSEVELDEVKDNGDDDSSDVEAYSVKDGPLNSEISEEESEEEVGIRRSVKRKVDAVTVTSPAQPLVVKAEKGQSGSPQRKKQRVSKASVGKGKGVEPEPTMDKDEWDLLPVSDATRYGSLH